MLKSELRDGIINLQPALAPAVLVDELPQHSRHIETSPNDYRLPTNRFPRSAVITVLGSHSKIPLFILSPRIETYPTFSAYII